jgi:hypothetical protein
MQTGKLEELSCVHKHPVNYPLGQLYRKVVVGY